MAHPRQNILLRRGDVVTMITNPSTFTSMGAVGHTQQIGFSVKGLSLAEAVGRMGGSAGLSCRCARRICIPLCAFIRAAS